MNRRAILTWVLMIPVAIANAALRESLLVPQFGELRGHQLSTLTGSAALFGTAYVMLHADAPQATDRTMAKIGIGWVVGTVGFEFGAGHYVFGNSWEKLFADYNLLNGRIWTVVLVTLLVSPLLVKRLATRRAESKHVARSSPRHSV